MSHHSSSFPTQNFPRALHHPVAHPDSRLIIQINVGHPNGTDIPTAIPIELTQYKFTVPE